MKKQLFILFALVISISAGFAQTYEKDYYAPFFEQVTYQGAFAPAGQGNNKITLYGQTIKKADGSDWVLNPKGNWLQDWTNWDPQNTIYPGDAAYNAATQGAYVDGGTKSGDIITNTVWGADNQKTLIEISGAIHVTNGATLTIKPNTIIRGNANNISFLLIAKGAKLYAIGTPDQPIVFTSIKAPGQRTSGDWAGFLLMGKSQNNTSPNGTGVRNFEALPTDPLSEYGGGANFDIHDNSGECRFLRVEFAGYNYLPDQEINGVTFGAVGDQTRFDFCQVSFSRDDSFEWFGGTPNHKYLVAWAGIDDDFDQDEGYEGKLQFCLGVRKYDVFETSAGGTSHGFEHDNNTGLGTSAQNVLGIVNPQPSTRPRLSNITMVGPRIGSSTNIPQIASNRFGAGMAFRTGDESCVYNSIITGYPRQWELYHNSSALVPSAHQKLLGVSDVANYQANEVQNVILILDKNDNRSGLSAKGFAGVPNGIVEQQQVPTFATDQILTLSPFSSTGKGAYFDPATGAYSSSGMLMDDTGFPIWVGTITTGNLNASSKNNTFTKAYTATDVFTNPFYWQGGSIVTPDYSLNTTWTLGNTPGFTASYLALNSLAGVGAFDFSVAPSTLPNMVTQLNTPSTPFVINISSFGLTATGIAISSSSGSFQVSVDGGTSWGATSLDANSGSVWVRYTSSVAGSGSGLITFTPTDTRAAAQSVNVNGLAAQPALPFVMASQATLANFTTTFINTESDWQSFTIAGNLLGSTVTVTSPVNFEISSDGSTFTTSTLVFTPAYKQLMPTVVYVKYKPTTGVTTLGGSDMGNITIASQGAITENVAVSGNWGFTLQVGPVDPANNANLLQYIAVPSLPTFVSYTGVPSASQVSYVKAWGVPAGQSVIVHSLTGLSFSTDNVTFSSSPLTFAPDANGNVAPTPFYVRFIGTGSLGTYGALGGNVIGVGLTGTTNYDKLMGLQGATAIAPATITGIVTGITSNVITATGATFTSKLAPGVAVYLGGVKAPNFVGIVSSVVSDTVVVLDRPVTSAAVSLAATAKNAGMINVQSNTWESNKDFNRGALWFPTGTLNANGFNVNSQQPGVITISGYSPIAAFVGRDYSTEYALRYEVSLDNATWTDIVSITGTNGVISPTLVYVRYNPTGSNVTGHVAGNPVAVNIPGYGQHTGSILVGSATNTTSLAAYTGVSSLPGVVMTGSTAILYTVGYSDPILYASSTKLPSYPGIGDVNSSLSNLRTVSNMPSLAVPVYVFGTRLQSDITVSSPVANFEVSTDGISNWGSSLTLSKDANSNYVGAYYVRFNPLNSTEDKQATITVATTKTSQGVDVSGFPVPAPTSVITTSGIELSVKNNAVGYLTVGGFNLTAPITVTAPSNFMISTGAVYAATLSIVPNSTNFGSVSSTLMVTFTGTVSVSGVDLTLASSGADNELVVLSGSVAPVTGITIEKTISAAIYPNPSKGSVTIALTDHVDATITVVSYTGTIVNEGIINGLTHEITGLAPGLYLVRITTQTGSHVAKLVVE